AMSLFRAPVDRAFALQPVVTDLRTVTGQICLNAIFLFDQAVLATDAIARTTYRMLFSKKHLLEWQTAGQTERRLAGKVPPRMLVSSLLALAVAASMLLPSARGAIFAAPWLACW